MPPSEADLPLRSIHTDTFVNVLDQLGISLVVSTYQAGKLILIRADGEAINTHVCPFNKPMGLAADREKLAIGSAHQIWELRNIPAVAQTIGPKHDACYLPRQMHVTGDIDIHEMAWAKTGPNRSDELWFVNTRFSCLCTLDSRHSFVPRWRPPFVSAYEMGDRCHLNGLAIQDGQPRYVTALGETDTPGGWREHKANGGILMDITSNKIIARGLSMPHSPRWYRNQLWVLESGKGSLARVDVETGNVPPVVELPGFTRGIDFYGDFAFIGLSQIRESAFFSDIPLTKTLSESISGVWVVNILTGETVAFLKFQDAIQEIFAVSVLEGQRFPEIVDLQDPLQTCSFVLPDDALTEAVDRDREFSQPYYDHDTQKLLGIGWPLGMTTGWGNFGLNLMRQLQAMPDVIPISMDLPQKSALLDSLYPRLWQQARKAQQRYLHSQPKSSDRPNDLNFPLLHALGNHLQSPTEHLRGTPDVGVVFFENTNLSPDAIARGQRYAFIAAGSTWNKSLLQGHGLNQTEVILQGIDPAYFYPAPKANVFGDRFVIFSGGKLEFRKGQDIVTAAVRQFIQRYPETLLVTAWHNHWPEFIVGLDQKGHVQGLPQLKQDGSLDLSPWLAANGLPAENVHSLNATPNHKMGQIMREADVALFPNRAEGGTNLVAMECMACGVPTILSANTGHLDLIDSDCCYPLQHQAPVTPYDQLVGVEGWGESDVDEVLEHLERVYCDRTEAKQKGTAAAHLMQDWTWEKQMGKLCEILKEKDLWTPHSYSVRNAHEDFF
ncbi:MAG: TIGR03032 family protein [Leptolyngbya sp. SIO3F4]|nr:TIGR03032 family protein [Leptolyngbya sp. SIO3F4]